MTELRHENGPISLCVFWAMCLNVQLLGCEIREAKTFFWVFDYIKNNSELTLQLQMGNFQMGLSSNANKLHDL